MPIICRLLVPTGSQAARAIDLALKDAGLEPTDIDYINAHGSSTPLNDKTETQAIKRIFGEHAARIPIRVPRPCMVIHWELQGPSKQPSGLKLVLRLSAADGEL